MKYTYTIFFAIMLIIAACQPQHNTVSQSDIERVNAMPAMPEPYKMLDWHEKAHNFDQYIFNLEQDGEHLPFVWMDSSERNLPQTTFGMFTVISDVRQGPDANAEFHEALTAMGAVLGAGLVGIDKTDQDGMNYAKMLQNYFNADNGWNIMMNNTNPEVAMLGGGYGRDWWYDVFPNVLYYAVCDVFPDVPQADSLQRIIAEQFYKADAVLDGNYDYSYFDYSSMEGKRNHIPYQQDAAAGHAYVLLCAYEKFGDERYLEAAKSATEALLSQEESRFYEILMPFGAYTAARLNAEHGTDYDVKQLIDWTFEGTTAEQGRTGWGVIAERWGDYDVYGLQGSTIASEGYAFLMNTIDLSWPLVPLVKYDSRYALAMGKWMLNASNASRLYYPYEIDDRHQWLPEQKEITKNVIAYEGLRQKDVYDKEQLRDVTPVALGDGPNWLDGQPEVSMFSLYSSAQVGVFGAIIRKTDVEGILQLDCNATDFYQQHEFPVYLYYNPHETAQQVCFQSEAADNVDLYDMITHEFIARDIAENGCFEIPASEVVLLSVLPSGTEVEEVNGRYMAGEAIVAYQ